jgi:hypothetical protein
MSFCDFLSKLYINMPFILTEQQYKMENVDRISSFNEDFTLLYHHHHHHHCWQTHPFLSIVLLRRFCQITCGFQVFGFRNNNFFSEQGRQPCVKPPTWRARSLYLCPPVTGWSRYTPRHLVTFSSPSMTRREVF